jgi:hypothetical protein
MRKLSEMLGLTAEQVDDADQRARQERRENDKEEYIKQRLREVRAWERRISGRKH